ncbi:MAG: tetratricopeptide repeat protein [Okeania sp. SIO3B5]|uniref:CHAT domain-containing protein n=1 Tax=Okeania sp. SIO3B5 TaxID=2607811 RepID=UPI0013FF1CEF|nr:CHAT domain-containing protein [Okeania sp. SIO3B5]NEO51921.1 tetratricopeptide repeat protein [Okeania sp. SIO3B5]
MDEQFNFLIDILQATADSNRDPKIIYPLLQANLDKLDENFANILRSWAKIKLSEVETDAAELIANAILYFSSCLSDFPLGNKAHNMEIVIAGYKIALKVFTRESKPEIWAITQNNLGVAYLDRIRGDRAENMEKAIAAFNLALQLYTKKDFPMQWANIQNNLGISYRDKICDDWAENLEKAIEAFQQALSVYSRADFPIQWANIQNHLGTSYGNRIRDDRAKNLEKAIDAFQQALLVYSRADFPIDWAMTQGNLGNAYRLRIRHDKAENEEKAIDAFQQALLVCTREDFPIEWAKTQNNIGNAYTNRISGDRVQNLEKAIAAFNLVLEVLTKKDFPIDWATTQNNLGVAYNYRISGDPVQNLEKAIAAYNLALEIRTKKDFPYEWAMIQDNLGNAYSDRIIGNRAENLENAIAAYQRALEIRTKKDFPIDWAGTQNNLAVAYSDRISGDPAENLEDAIAAYNLALEVHTLNANPINHLTTSRSLGNLHFKEGNWKPAIAAYEKAITAVELIRSWSKDDDRRQEILEGSIVVYQNIIQCFVNLQQYDKALEYAERSRSRMVAELMASKDLYPNAEILQHLLEEYYRLQQLLSNLHRSNSVETFHGTSLPNTHSRFERRDSGEVEKQRLAEIEKIEAKRQKIWREIRSFDPVLAGQLQVDSMSIQQIQRLIKDKETAILNFYTTKNDTYIFIVRQQDIQLYTCRGEGIEIFQNWVGQNWLKLYIENKAEWRNNMGTFLQQLAQRLQLDRLIAQHLTDIKELIIVPHIFLHQIPFAALPITTETVTIADNVLVDNTKGMKFNRRSTQTQTKTISKTYLSDKFRLRVLPSCQILSYCDNRNKSTDSPKMGIVENATGDLMFTQYECQNLAQMFQVPNNLHLKYQQATVNNYRQLAKQVQILHSSHHASADLINPLESKLKLFDGEITLGDVFTWRLPKLTDVFLSCCETNLTFINKLNDDILTIAAGFLSAGAQSVVSTLWAVEDKSTAEFCQLYYQFRNQGETRPEALRKAQFELRKREDFKHPYYWAGFVSQGLQ